MTIDSGPGNDIIEFRDDSSGMGYYANYVMSSDGGHDKIIRDEHLINPADPYSNYNSNIFGIYLKYIEVGDLVLKKKLVDTWHEVRQSPVSDGIDYVFDWYDVNYKIETLDGGTSVDLGNYRWFDRHLEYFNIEGELVSSHFGRWGFVNEAFLVDANGMTSMKLASSSDSFSYVHYIEEFGERKTVQPFDLGIDDIIIVS